MQSERALEILAQYQRSIMTILCQGRRTLAASDASQMMALALIRWEMTRTLREYQLFKHGEIFDPIMRVAGSPRGRVAAALKERCLCLGEAFRKHVQRWSLEGPATAWDDYQREAISLAVQIEQHLEMEMREITALLVGLARTRER